MERRLRDRRSKRASAEWVHRIGNRISWLWQVGISGKPPFVERDDFIEAPVQLRRVTGVIGDTVADMIFQKFGLERPQRGMDGGDRVENIGAFPVVFNHSPDPFDLAGNLLHSVQKGRALVAIAIHTDTPRGYCLAMQME